VSRFIESGEIPHRAGQAAARLLWALISAMRQPTRLPLLPLLRVRVAWSSAVCRLVVIVPVKINPMRLQGAWQSGYALDLHHGQQHFPGTDSFGHDVFDTTRSEIGELLYRMKYARDRTTLRQSRRR